jgi:ribonuclease VapC
MFLDASAIVAILAREPDAESLLQRIGQSSTQFFFSPLSFYEAASGLARAKTIGPVIRPEMLDSAYAAVSHFLADLEAVEIPITTAITYRAIEAAQKYGRSVGHPARLNLGDCFSYACARHTGVPLLYKGEDFAQTDMA